LQTKIARVNTAFLFGPKQMNALDLPQTL